MGPKEKMGDRAKVWARVRLRGEHGKGAVGGRKKTLSTDQGCMGRRERERGG